MLDHVTKWAKLACGKRKNTLIVLKDKVDLLGLLLVQQCLVMRTVNSSILVSDIAGIAFIVPWKMMKHGM